jgi:hypothetical protein
MFVILERSTPPPSPLYAVYRSPEPAVRRPELEIRGDDESIAGTNVMQPLFL